MTGLHCIMLALEAKIGNSLCSSSSVHMKFLVNVDCVMLLCASDKG